MEAHFARLGLRRGATEGDVNKAYRRKALELHPDRNPNGGEAFKRVNESYHAILQYFKRGGSSDDFGDTLSRTTTYSTTTATRRGSNPTYANMERHASAPVFTSDAHSSAHAQRQSAHHGRTPLSGYQPFTNDDEMNAFVAQMKHFEQMEQRKRDLAAMGVETPHSNARYGGAGGSDGRTFPESRAAPPRPPMRRHTEGEDDDRRQRQQREAQEEAVSAEEARRVAREREREREREVAAEWSRIQKEMEEARARDAANAAADAAAARVNAEREQYFADVERRRVARQRHQERSERLAVQLPSVAAISGMTEVELAMTQEKLSELLRAIDDAMLDLRQRKVCANCGAEGERESRRLFDCDHRTTCAACSAVLSACPICTEKRVENE